MGARTAQVLGAVLAIAAAGAAAAGIVDTRHNLSISGPGTVKAATEDRVCVFCHTPHRASAAAQLWNRTDPAAAYTPYASTTLEAAPGQPTGASRLCLSCHDGTIALGLVLSEADPIAMAGGVTVMPAGEANLTADLGDDHPVSFAYTAALAALDGHLADPGTLTGEVRLDATGQLQCTTCHDPHDDANGDFLVLPATDAALCEACHQPQGWQTGTHNGAKSLRAAAAKDVPSANDCVNCHAPHSGLAGQRLLYQEQEEQGCLVCHSAAGGATDIQTQVAKLSSHDPSAYEGIHDPLESLPAATVHVECVDCHDPHAARTESTAAPLTTGPLADVRGVDADGLAVDPAVNEYEVCYRCHADGPGAPPPATPRLIVQGNTRLEFDPANPSYHPIEAAGASASVPSLKAPWTTASIIRCTDCHTSEDSPAAGGTGPAGPHGSDYEPLLGWNYFRGVGTIESATVYALCYRCHDRALIFGLPSWPGHSRHVKTARMSCNLCHDPHGISASQGTLLNNTRLMNFDSDYCSPETSTGVLEFVDLGSNRARCTMLCHGANHLNETW